MPDNISKKRYNLALTVFAAIWLGFIAFQLFKVTHTPIWRDDAVFGEVAKNLVSGNGYALVAFDKFYPFQRGISAGPAVILPAAAMIKWFGNSYWAPGLANVLLINLLLVIIFFQLRPLLLRAERRLHCASLFLPISLLITTHDMGFPGELMLLWHALMGEVPSALFIVLAALVIAAQRERKPYLLAGGMLAGLGALCKLQALVGGGALGLYLAFCCFADRKQEKQSPRAHGGRTRQLCDRPDPAAFSFRMRQSGKPGRLAGIYAKTRRN